MSSQRTLRQVVPWVLSLLVFSGTTILTNLCAGPPMQAQIRFQSDRDGNNEIYVMDTHGQNERSLNNSPGNDNEPDWFDPDFARETDLQDYVNATWAWLKTVSDRGMLGDTATEATP